MVKRAYADIPEGQIHYQFEGKGESLLLLNQGFFNSDDYLKMMPILGQRCQVIARDMLGYGKSDPNPSDFRIEDYARADVNLMKSLGIKKATIAGVHTGATIAIEIAAAYPEMVNKLVLYGVPSFGPGVREACINSHTFGPVDIKPDGSHFLWLWRAAQKYGPEANPEIWTKVVGDGATATGGPFHGEHAIFRYDEEKRLPLLKCPVLLLSGTKDVFHYRLDNVKSLVPRHKVRLIEGTDTYVALEKPEEFAQAILDFMKDPGV